MMSLRSPLWKVCLLLMAILLLPGRPARAHRIFVYGYTSGEDLVVQCSWGNDRPVVHGKVQLLDPKSGKILATGISNQQGISRLPRPRTVPATGLLVVLEAGSGHRAVWKMDPQDLGVQSNTTVSSPPRQTAPAQPDTLPPASGDLDKQALARLIDASVARQIAPLQAMLARHVNRGPTLESILGGIGWLVGIGGLLAALRAREKN